MTKVKTIATNDGCEVYSFENGWEMKREYGNTPYGNPVGGRWALRDENGNWIDCDQYRSDLAEAWELELT